MNAQTRVAIYLKAVAFQEEIDKAEAESKRLRAEATRRGREFMQNLHGTHMAPGKFR